MARYSAGALTTAGSTTLPIISVYGISGVAPKVREIGIFNTTATSVALKLVLLSTAGTQGTGLTETKHDPNSVTANCTAFNTHSVAPTAADLGYRCVLPAQIGAGIVWTFGGDVGISCPTGTGNGIGVIVENGTGQACQAYIVWDE